MRDEIQEAMQKEAYYGTQARHSEEDVEAYRTRAKDWEAEEKQNRKDVKDWEDVVPHPPQLPATLLPPSLPPSLPPPLCTFSALSRGLKCLLVTGIC